jgi:hypothetical protein
MTKYYGSQPPPAQWLAEFLRKRGVPFDAKRAEEQVAAEQERRKVDHAEHLDYVRAKGAQVRRARRATEIEEWAWRQNPSAENLERAKAAQQARKVAEDELLEAVCFDRQLYRDVLRSA